MSAAPWSRIKQPPAIPVDLEELVTLPQDEFAEILRANLLPAQDNRRRWETYWNALGTVDDLRRVATGILTDWIKQANQADDSVDAAIVGTAAEQRRRQQFQLQCERSLDRLAKIRSGGDGFVDELRKAIAAHQVAISSGQDRKAADERLWEFAKSQY